MPEVVDEVNKTVFKSKIDGWFTSAKGSSDVSDG
jgi:hypothetical protein